MTKSTTLDMIVGSKQTIKSDFYYYNIPSAPQPNQPIYYTTYETLSKIYQTTKYLTEFVYNILFKK